MVSDIWSNSYHEAGSRNDAEAVDVYEFVIGCSWITRVPLVFRNSLHVSQFFSRTLKASIDKSINSCEMAKDANYPFAYSKYKEQVVESKVGFSHCSMLFLL